MDRRRIETRPASADGRTPQRQIIAKDHAEQIVDEHRRQPSTARLKARTGLVWAQREEVIERAEGARPPMDAGDRDATHRRPR